MLDDGAAALFFPGPHPLEESLAADAVAGQAFGLQMFDHHAFGGDAGVIGAGLPQGVATLHAPPADQGVLQRVVEGMPHVQHAGDIGRRDGDGVRRLAGAFARSGLETPGVLPAAIDLAFDGGGGVTSRQVERHAQYSSRARNHTPRGRPATAAAAWAHDCALDQGRITTRFPACSALPASQYGLRPPIEGESVAQFFLTRPAHPSGPRSFGPGGCRAARAVHPARPRSSSCLPPL